MKKFGKILVAVLIFGLMVVLPAAAQKTKADFQKMYVDYLKKRGFNPQPNNDGYIVFYIEQLGFNIFINEKEPQLFVAFLNVSLSTTADKAMMAAHWTNQNNFGVKAAVYPDNGVVCFSVEQLLPKPKDFSLVFDQLIIRLTAAWLFYYNETEG
jgi:hypothetical protein